MRNWNIYSMKYEMIIIQYDHEKLKWINVLVRKNETTIFFLN
jgi:hypothetical protein